MVELNFEHIDSLNLSLSKIEIINKYQPKLSRPNVEHLFKTPPSRLISDYAKSKFLLKGGRNNLQFIIEEASVIETIKETKKILLNNISIKESLINYKCKFRLRIKLKSEKGLTKSYILVSTIIDKTIKSNISLNERDKVFFEINENMILKLDSEINKQARKYFINDIVK
tara:strand:- start:207 stop:716 length:510 start_codon:yes stop_codon:yes gene_type:complete